MAEMVDKVYCMDRPQNDNLLLAELMNSRNQGTDAATMSALFSRDNNNQWNNPFMYLIWLAMFRNGGFGFGGNGDACANSKIDALGAQMQTNQNTNLAMDAINGNHEALHSLSTNLGVGITQLQSAIGNVQNAITAIGGQVGMSSQQVINSILLGNKDLTAALQSCCCEQKSMAYETQIRDLQNTSAINSNIENSRQATVNGFANIGYTMQTNKCDIVSAIKADGDATRALLTQHWNAQTERELAKAELKLSQLEQNAYLVGKLGGGCNCASF